MLPHDNCLGWNEQSFCDQVKDSDKRLELTTTDLLACQSRFIAQQQDMASIREESQRTDNALAVLRIEHSAVQEKLEKSDAAVCRLQGDVDFARAQHQADSRHRHTSLPVTLTPMLINTIAVGISASCCILCIQDK